MIRLIIENKCLSYFKGRVRDKALSVLRRDCRNHGGH